MVVLKIFNKLEIYSFYYPNDTKNIKEDLIKFSSQFDLNDT